MARVWSHLLVMLWMLAILSGSIYLFSRGFLLSRNVQVNYNECTRLELCETDSIEVGIIY